MRSPYTLSIVLLSRWGEHLPRMFQSLAWQSGDLSRVEVVYVDTGEDEEATKTGLLWAGILTGGFIHLHLPPTTEDFHAANQGLAAATGLRVTYPHRSVRFDPYFLEDVTTAFENKRHLDVLYSDFVDLGEAAAGLVQLPRFAKWRLRGRNVIGPLAVYRTDTLASLPGLRPDTPFESWDLAVQAALHGCTFQRLPRVTYGCFLKRPDDDEARIAAAMVVVNNQGFFAKEVVRWALAATRRAPWALRAEPFRIPVAREVRQLMNDHVAEENDHRPGWLWSFTGEPAMAPVAMPVLESEG